MIYNEVRKMAKRMGINIYSMRKTDMIRSIQAAENNMECYGTQRVEYCHEDACIWKKDCLSLSHNSKANPS